MPIRRKRRRVSRRRFRRSRKTSVIARRALRLASRVANSREVKYFSPTNFIVGQSPGRSILDSFFTPQTGINRGTLDTERIGDSVRFRNLQIRGAYRYTDLNVAAPTAPYKGNIVMFWCALYKRPELTAPLNDITRIFENNDQDNATPYAFKQWDNRLNAKLLMRKYIIIDTQKMIKPFVYNIRIPFKTQWDGSSGLIQTNKLYFGWISNKIQNPVNGTFVEIDFKYRITYTDD